MSAIIDKLRAMIKNGARLNELVDSALADGYVLDLRMVANTPGNDNHKIIERDGEKVEVASL